MSLSTEDVRKIADYARIALSEDELQEMCAYMNDAIELLEPIRSYNLEGVEPTFHPIGELANVMRSDEVDGELRALDIETALKNAGSTDGRFFRVPQILGSEEGGA